MAGRVGGHVATGLDHVAINLLALDQVTMNSQAARASPYMRRATASP